MKKHLIEFDGSITISRPNYSTGEEWIEIVLVDERSNNQFVRVKLSYSDFTRAITNQAYIPMKFSVNALDVVGKKKESKELLFPVPDYMSGKEWASEHAHEFVDEGWTASTYFGSQSSLKKRADGDGYYASGTQFRYVEVTE